MGVKKLTPPPRFQSEQEEADWWYQNRKQVEESLSETIRANRSLSLQDVLAKSAKKKLTSEPVTIRFSTSDLTMARQLAGEKGVGYQTYIKLLLHDALIKESNRLSRSRR